MAEILLEGRDCEACGTPVRKGALFCYHCGASVAPDVVVTTDIETEKVADARFQKDAAESVDNGEDTDDSDKFDDAVESEIVEDKITEDDAKIDEDKSVIEDDKAEAVKQKTTSEKDADAEIEEKSKLKTAAAMRRKPKYIQKKRVEIVWDKPNSPPNVRFLIATILFATLAVCLWMVARYLG